MRTPTRSASRRRVEAEIDLLKWTQRPSAAAADPKAVALAREELQGVEATIALNKKLIDGGAWDVNTLFNIIQLHTTRLRLTRDLDGDTPDTLRAFERFLSDAQDLLNVILNRYEKGTVREQDLRQTQAHVASVKKEVQLLKTKLGVK